MEWVYKLPEPLQTMVMAWGILLLSLVTVAPFFILIAIIGYFVDKIDKGGKNGRRNGQ